jgi:hypothetical protein
MHIKYLHVSAELNLEQCQASLPVSSTKRADTVDEETVIHDRSLKSLFPIPLAANCTSDPLIMLMISIELTGHAVESSVKMNTKHIRIGHLLLNNNPCPL